jgi:hypothetical protein
MTPEELADEIVRDWRRSENTLELKRRIAAALREAERPAETEKVKTRGEVVAEKAVIVYGNGNLGFESAGCGVNLASTSTQFDAGMMRMVLAELIDAAIANERERCLLAAQVAKENPRFSTALMRVRMGIMDAIRAGS